MNKPVWGFKKKFNDGKFHLDWTFPIPGYAESVDHPFLKISSKTYPTNEWCFGDNKENYEACLKKAPPDWKYRTKKIYYNLNSSGYRTYEWNDIDWKEAIVLLGCSNTFGMAVAEDETISYFLEALTQRQVVNLGYPSGSNDTIVNNLSTVFEKFGTPYAVVINWSCLDRFRYYHKFEYIDVGVWNNPVDGMSPKTVQDNVDISELYQLQAMDQYNLWMKGYYLSKHALAMCKGRTKYVTFSYFGESALWMRADGLINFKGNARDMIHPGDKEHKEAAEFIYERLQQSS